MADVDALYVKVYEELGYGPEINIMHFERDPNGGKPDFLEVPPLVIITKRLT